MADLAYTVPGLGADDSLRASRSPCRTGSTRSTTCTSRSSTRTGTSPGLVSSPSTRCSTRRSRRCGGFTDDLAERIAQLGASPVGTPGRLVAERGWTDYTLGKADTQDHLARPGRGLHRDHRVEPEGDHPGRRAGSAHGGHPHRADPRPGEVPVVHAGAPRGLAELTPARLVLRLRPGHRPRLLPSAARSRRRTHRGSRRGHRRGAPDLPSTVKARPRGGPGMPIADPSADELTVLQDEAVQFTRELIRIDTTNFGGN